MDLLSWMLPIATTAYVAIAFAFRIGLSRQHEPRETDDTPFVSVIVAARNEEAYLGECLERLASQTYPGERYEILVVDDESADRTLEIARTAEARYPNVIALDVGSGFPEMAAKKRPMSVGLQQARGQIILTTDADCRVPTTWIAATVAYFEDDVAAVIGFSQVLAPGKAKPFLERLQALDFLALMSAAAGAANLGFPLAASGQNLAYRRSAFDRVGGFTQIAHRPSGDDVLLLQLMRRANCGAVRFAMNREAYVTTCRTETLGGFLRQRRRWASNARCQLRLNPAFFGYIASVFLVHALVPVCLLTATSIPATLMPLACWAAKVGASLLVVGKGAAAFDRRDLMRVFPVWELLQIPYILLVGTLGTLLPYTWKSRTHR
jgi:cellulose synthase/poly-beta-1,6-N-acetylglucosamine synthase-like glycosyltransferase